LPGPCVITREIAVAEGVIAPGHVGELTQIVPFEMAGAVLAECGAIQRRLRKLPARVVVYLLLAAALFEECGYLAVWARLTAALGPYLPVPEVTATGLWHARARLGVRPLRALFDLLAGPAAAIRTAGARWAGLLVVAIDGTHLDVPGDPAARARLGKGVQPVHRRLRLPADPAGGAGGVRHPGGHRRRLRPRSAGEIAHGQRLARSLRPGMIVLLDRGFASSAFLETVAGTGAAPLARLSASRKPPVLRRLPDGSFVSRIGTLQVRVIECEITIATVAGRHTGTYRPATTLLDSRRHPAFELVKLYHERWEVESAYFAIKKTMPGRRVLRSRTLPGIAQEIYALLAACQLIKIAIADATMAIPGADPDRASFTIALQAARDQVIQAANVIAGETIDLAGTIGRHVLANLLPARRLRLSPRAVKRPLSRYAHKSLRADRRTYKATISIDILTTQLSP
jgi:hypothetical protein